MAKILLIEDEPDQLEMIKTRLEAGGYQVITAGNGEEGIRLALEVKPDLILMDMILPGMHGLEATIKLKENPETKEIPIIALTAVGSSEFERQCFKDGICAYIKKPYESQEILENIEKHIKTNNKEDKAEIRREEVEVVKNIPSEPGMNLEKKLPVYAEEEKLEEEDIEEIIEKHITSEDTEKKIEIRHEIDDMLKDTLSEFGLTLEKKSPPVHDKQKKLEEEEKIEHEERVEKQIKLDNKKKEVRESKKTGKKILIVEDEQSLLNLIAIRLKKHGYEVISASDGLSGVNKTLKEKPDLILLDIVMPAGGGITVIENLKRSHKTMFIPIILMSAKYSPGALEKIATKLGAEDSIPKPFESEVLIRKIEKTLGE